MCGGGGKGRVVRVLSMKIYDLTIRGLNGQSARPPRGLVVSKEGREKVGGKKGGKEGGGGRADGWDDR